MDFPHLVVARFYEHIEPIDRGNRYEDPVQAALDQTSVGNVTGGGSQLNELGGSELIHAEDGRVLRQFGTHECLAIYLDGISLPDEVYADLDFESVVDEIGAAAGPDSYHGFSQGNEETGLFFFGANADDMFARVEPVLAKLPVAQNARVVIRHGKQVSNPREVRMPRQ
jgi:hypothetical protein